MVGGKSGPSAGARQRTMHFVTTATIMPLRECIQRELTKRQNFKSRFWTANALRQAVFPFLFSSPHPPFSFSSSRNVSLSLVPVARSKPVSGYCSHCFSPTILFSLSFSLPLFSFVFFLDFSCTRQSSQYTRAALFDAREYAKGGETEWFSVNGRNWVVSTCVFRPRVFGVWASVGGTIVEAVNRGVVFERGKRKGKRGKEKETVSLLNVAPVFIPL